MKNISILKIALVTLLIFIYEGCTNRPNFMRYEVFFHAPLGTGLNEIGSNIPLLKENFSNSQEIKISDYLDIPTSIQIFKNKLYIADKYNKRVSVFNISKDTGTNLIILSSGEGYKFDTPFQVAVNKYGEIYVVASISNIERKTYTNLNMEEYNEDVNFVDTNSEEGYNNFYIFKFSPDGRFIYSIGEKGIHSEPMSYPLRIEVDLFDNLYAYYKYYEGGREIWIVKRFSSSGELNFEFNTRYISSTNIKGDKVFAGRVSDIYNLKNDERLMIYSDYYIVQKKNTPVGTPDEVYHSLDVYSVLQNSITKNIFQSRKYIDQFIKITRDDILVLYSYDERFNGVRFRFIDIASSLNSQEVYYAPIISDNYPNFGFYVDDYGEIYSMVVKDNSYFVLLKWKKVKSKVS